MNKMRVTVMVMESQKKEVPSFTVMIPDNYTIQDLINFLNIERKVPFSNYFLTNKPAERWQFSNDKTLKEIRPQCQEYNDSMLLLCYETSIKPVEQLDSGLGPKKAGKNDTQQCCYLI